MSTPPGYAADVKLRATVHQSWSEVDPTAWDDLAQDASPFVEHAWLWGLERSGAACADTGWLPRPVTLERDGVMVAGAPAWIVEHESGQFVYQGHWSRAAHDAGLSLEPKVILGVPFTPVAGERLLLHPSAEPNDRLAVLEAVAKTFPQVEGLHLFFPTEAEAALAASVGLFPRVQYQYHWLNQNYQDFDAFLARFRSRKRKEIRRERAALRELHFSWIDHPTPADMALMWRAYDATVRHHGDTDRFLTQAFFEHLAEHFAHRLRLVLATKAGEPVGAAMCVHKGDRLYGRYAGQLERIPFLHFELCYYQGIERCIAEGLSAYEPGHGGEHKFARGFEPVLTWSAHAFRHRGAHRAFAEAAVREQAWVDDKIAELRRTGPLKPA